MEYIDWLERAEEFFKAWKREHPDETFIYPEDLLETIETEKKAVAERGELAIAMTAPAAGSEVTEFFCAWCGLKVTGQPHVCETRTAIDAYYRGRRHSE